jgi:hypothetical protein
MRGGPCLGMAGMRHQPKRDMILRGSSYELRMSRSNIPVIAAMNQQDRNTGVRYCFQRAGLQQIDAVTHARIHNCRPDRGTPYSASKPGTHCRARVAARDSHRRRRRHPQSATEDCPGRREMHPLRTGRRERKSALNPLFSLSSKIVFFSLKTDFYRGLSSETEHHRIRLLQLRAAAAHLSSQPPCSPRMRL